MRSVPSQCAALGGRSRSAGCSSNTSSGCVASTDASTAHTTSTAISTIPMSADRSRASRRSTKNTPLTADTAGIGRRLQTWRR
jgi:hypothetical protein